MQSTRKPMPVGVEDFKRLVTEGYCFIDKTRFIKDYIDAQGVVTLITRPRRFGKTLTLSMLQYFFDSEQGEENRQLFSGLDIEGAGERYMQEQGSRPVVFLTLKEVQAGDKGLMLELLARAATCLQATALRRRKSTASAACWNFGEMRRICASPSAH